MYSSRHGAQICSFDTGLRSPHLMEICSIPQSSRGNVTEQGAKAIPWEQPPAQGYSSSYTTAGDDTEDSGWGTFFVKRGRRAAAATRRRRRVSVH